MDCLSPSSPVERVVFMKAAQIGATECGNNWIGYVIHHALAEVRHARFKSSDSVAGRPRNWFAGHRRILKS